MKTILIPYMEKLSYNLKYVSMATKYVLYIYHAASVHC